ncbi:hypothetical protein PENANT_c021G03731 [Penicillium antarcticum]|uniref:Retrotransposon gag domain-containing protein n=1 Tax=Penicillium antarcticum TaxID=416450 RepID=A0A1V6PZK7_9EURO|nr:hypothetical protein PENANT_c021G03731 [Penicillium antarcticum]
MPRVRSPGAGSQLMDSFIVTHGPGNPNGNVTPIVAELDAMMAFQSSGLLHNQRHQELPEFPHSYEVPLPGNTAEDEKARKRISEDDRPKYPFGDIKIYHGRSIREFEHWIFNLTRCFDENKVWFAYPPHRIIMAATYLSRDLLYAWSLHESACTTTPTWAEFEKWSRSLVDTRSDTKRSFDASRIFYTIRQRRTETVREFNDRANDHWLRLEQPPMNEEYRKEFLKSKVLRSIREEDARYFPHDSLSYMDYMHRLREIEDRLPERQKALRKRKKVLRKNAERETPGATCVTPNRSLLWRTSRPETGSHVASAEKKAKKARGRRKTRYSEPSGAEIVL